jgi:hypothetical protein
VTWHGKGLGEFYTIRFLPRFESRRGWEPEALRESDGHVVDTNHIRDQLILTITQQNIHMFCCSFLKEIELPLRYKNPTVPLPEGRLEELYTVKKFPELKNHN